MLILKRSNVLTAIQTPGGDGPSDCVLVEKRMRREMRTQIREYVAHGGCEIEPRLPAPVLARRLENIQQAGDVEIQGR